MAVLRLQAWRRSGRLRDALAAVGALSILLVSTPVLSWVGWWIGSPWPAPRGATLIVLGGGLISDGRLAPDSYWRTIQAARAWQEGGWQRIVVSGAGVARPMKQFLVASGVPEEAILLEESSTSTRENAVATARLLAGREGPAVLLTSEVHMFRARRAFARAGLAVLPRPAPHIYKERHGQSANLSDFLHLITEGAKIIGYWVRGWL